MIGTGRTWKDLLQTPSRWSEPYGWVAFVPKEPFLEYPFDVLNDICMPIFDEKTKLYSLPQKTIAEWNRLFTNIRFLCLRLSEVYKTPICEPYPPHAWKFCDKFKSFPKAGHCFERSRDWFQMWFGLLSYLIARAETEEPNERPKGSNRRPHWRQFIIQEGLPVGWVDGLDPKRWIGIPRVGTIIESDFTG